MKNNRNRSSYIPYIIYVAIILVLGYFMFTGDDDSPKDINSVKFCQILEKQDCEKIVVVNGEFAEVYIKKMSIKNDTAYSDLRGKNEMGRPDVLQNFYIYKFATLEGLNSEIEEARNIIIQRDTTGKGLTDQEKRDVISNTRFNQTSDTRADIWRNVFSFLWPILFIVLFFVIMNMITRRQMGGGSGGGIFSVGKSRAQMYDAKTQTNITFKDVAGLAEAKVEIMEIVDFLKNPKKYTALGGKIPKGALLVGPPGTGKTLLAKAVAGEAKVPFFSLSGSDFVEMFVGVGASRVRDLFKTAKEKAPCIVFIDEIDAIGRARGRNAISGSNDERESTLNQLLTEMDGFSTNTGVIIMAATNRADVLDKALLRAGRFDRQIYVELPDIEERKEIFEVHMRGLKLDDSVDKDFLSRQTPGFSGADIANVCNEAALIAARHDKKTITKQDFLDAVDRIVGGLEKRTKVITPHEKRVIAYHESGHASVSWLLRWGNPLVKVTIVPRGKALGAAWYLPEERQITTYDQMFDDITSLLAGRAAEEIVFGEISTGALNDLERATKQAFAMVTYYGLNKKMGNISYYDSTGQSDMALTKPFSEKTAETIDEEVHQMLETAYQRAKALLLENRDKLDKLAEQLINREVIFREDLESIYGKRPFDDETKPADASEVVNETTPEPPADTPDEADKKNDSSSSPDEQ
ncbi:MAG: ATP-dependent zinc metalloprotease FtsH [Bacteroidales bacterium]|nr:ATP-dependent zinc metalloprotease FtsH [Bacteroidales bacterium]